MRLDFALPTLPSPAVVAPFLVLVLLCLASTLVVEEAALLGIPGVFGREVDIALRNERKPDRILSWAVGNGLVG